MALSFMAKFNSPLDWERLNQRLMQISKGLVEFFPIEAEPGVVHLGISVPLRSLGNPLWWEFRSVANHLLASYDCKIADLFSGKEIGLENLDELKPLFYG